MTPAEVASMLPQEQAEARCLNCGTNWEYRRHEMLRCPYCNIAFTSVYFNSKLQHVMPFLEFGGDLEAKR